MEYENSWNGIFQKKSITTRYYFFGIWNIPGIFQNIEHHKPVFLFFCLFWVFIIPFFFHHNIFLQFIGIWNIPKKMHHKKKYDIFGIWNIPRIFQKNIITTEILKILEYGIFHGIFQEYSKKSITTHGGVKFNQDVRWWSCNRYWSVPVSAEGRVEHQKLNQMAP